MLIDQSWETEQEKQGIWKRVRKADWILILFLMVLSGLLGITFFLSSSRGTCLVLSVDGRQIYEMPFKKTEMQQEKRYLLVMFDAEGKATVKSTEDLAPPTPETGAYNLLCVTADGVQMVQADCQDQICVHHREIVRQGESIICLPHRLTAEVRGEKTDAEVLDGMVN